MRENRFRISAIAILAVITAAFMGYYFYLRASADGAGRGSITVMENIEQSEVMEHPAFIKEEYIPVIPEGNNIAPDGKVTANSFQDVYTPRKATDGKTGGVSYWEGTDDAYPNILTVSFEEERTVHAVKVCLCPLPVWSRRSQEFSVEISTDGEKYNEIVAMQKYEFDPDKGNEVVIELEETTIRALRLVFQGNSGAGGAQVAELEIYEIPIGGRPK